MVQYLASYGVVGFVCFFLGIGLSNDLHERKETKKQNGLIELLAKEREQLLKKQQELYVELNEVEKTKTQELKDAQLENEKYRTCINNNTCGMRYVTKYVYSSGSEPENKDASSESMGNGETEIPRDVQQDLLNLREQLILEKAVVEYLQEYATICSKDE